jgi:molybdate transport system substrate-binding protein
MIKKYAIIVSLIITLLLAVIIWGLMAKPAKTELVISAAASLQDSLIAIQPEFERQNPHIKLAFNFGSTGTLQKQIEQGAPADVFLAAGAKQMKALVDKGLIDAAEQLPLLANDLVVVVPIDSSIKLEGSTTEELTKELTKEAYKHIAIGIPETVPAGAYAKQTLQNLIIYDVLASKLVQAKDVRQVLTYVETGNADAGFVYRTDAMTSKKVKILLTIDPKMHDPIIYPEGIVKASKHPKEAKSFYQYLQSKQASAVFVQYGFKLPESN